MEFELNDVSEMIEKCLIVKSANEIVKLKAFSQTNIYRNVFKHHQRLQYF